MSRLYYPQARAILSVVFDGFGDTSKDTAPKIIPVMPKSLTITRNAYNQADGWEMTFDADDLPIDPQMVKAGAVEIFLFGTKGIGPDERLIDKRSTTLDAPTQDRTAVDTVMTEMDVVSATDRFTLGNRPVIAGLWDDHTFALSDGGRWVTITGQDYTALLMAKQWPPTAKGRAQRIPVGKRLDTLMKEILSKADDTGRLALAVENIPVGDLPTVKAELRHHKRGIPVEQDTSYWDVLYKLATRHGFILFVRGLDVVLTTPQNLKDDKDRRIRRMVWGANITSLEMTRHLGKETTPAVVLKAYDDSLRAPLTIDYPEGSFTKIKKKARKSKAGKESINIRKTDEYVIIPVYGITDRQTLKRMAKARWTQLGESERQVTFATKDMSDFHDRDLMDLASGDAFGIEFDEFNIDRALLANPKVAPEVKFKHLTDRGFGAAVSQVIADKYDELEAMKRPMRVRECTYDYSADQGVSIECVLQDFIVVDGARDAAAKPPRKKKRRTRNSGKKLSIVTEGEIEIF